MPVIMVQNNQAGPTVLSIDPKGTESVEWQGKGDVNGEDVQPVSEAMQECVAFRKAIRRGVLVELKEDALGYIEDAERRQQEAWDRRQRNTQDVAEEHIDKATNNDIVALPCLGPSCDSTVNVKEGEKDARPPLCERHISLAPQFVPEQDMVGGRPATRWIRVTMGTPERSQ